MGLPPGWALSLSLSASALEPLTFSSSGIAPFHAFVFYAPADGSAAAAADCATLLLASLQAAASLGQVPVLLAGDLNQDPLPPAAAAALALAGWRDLAEGLGPTSDGGRRIDRVYANPWASLLVSSAALRRDLGLATHAAVEVRLRAAPRPPFLAAHGRCLLPRPFAPLGRVVIWSPRMPRR